MRYKIKSTHSDKAIRDLVREIQDHFVSLDNNGDINIDGSFRGDSVYVEGDSLHLGDVKVGKPANSEDNFILQADFSNPLSKTAKWVTTPDPNDHASTHEDGGSDEISIAGLSGTPAGLTTHMADTSTVHGMADTSKLNTSDAVIADNTLVRGDGGAQKIQGSGITVDDSDNITLPDEADIAVNTTTGTKIGTAAAQKIGFFGAAPVVQQAHIVDADGTLADITTKYNTLLSYLENLGFLADS